MTIVRIRTRSSSACRQIGPICRALSAALVLVFAVSACSQDAASQRQAFLESIQPFDFEAYNMAFAQCMRQEGFAVEVNKDGLAMPMGDQHEEGFAAMDRCETEMRERGLSPEPRVFSEGELAIVFDILVEWGDCLRRAGFEPTSAPSLDAFVESGGSIWNPTDSMGMLSDGEQARMNEACPMPLR